MDDVRSEVSADGAGGMRIELHPETEEAVRRLRQEIAMLIGGHDDVAIRGRVVREGEVLVFEFSVS